NPSISVRTTSWSSASSNSRSPPVLCVERATAEGTGSGQWLLLRRGHEWLHPGCRPGRREADVRALSDPTAEQSAFHAAGRCPARCYPLTPPCRAAADRNKAARVCDPTRARRSVRWSSKVYDTQRTPPG